MTPSVVGGSVSSGSSAVRGHRPLSDRPRRTPRATLQSPDELIFPAETGGYLRPGNSRSGWFAGACKRARLEDASDAAEATARGEGIRVVMPRVTPHDLRHTAVSLAISAGANVKAVQLMLGHASAAMTLDTYADLFDDELDDVASALDSSRELALRT